MRAIILALLVIGEVFGGPKEDAIKAVQNKFQDLVTKYENVKSTINAESKKTNSDQERQTKSELNNVFEKTSTDFLSSIKENTKTAIAKGKPLTAIECLVKVNLEGNRLIQQTKADFEKAIPEVLNYKREKLGLASLENELINTAVTDLKDTVLKKMEETNAPLETLKNDVLKKFETAKKQFQEIENQIPKPVLEEVYMALRGQIEIKFKETKEALIKKLQKCVA